MGNREYIRPFVQRKVQLCNALNNNGYTVLPNRLVNAIVTNLPPHFKDDIRSIANGNAEASPEQLITVIKAAAARLIPPFVEGEENVIPRAAAVQPAAALSLIHI